MQREAVHEWLRAYAAAWASRDAGAAAGLFTPDAIYRSSPFREPSVGTEGVRAYWERATRDQRNLSLRLGEPVIEGNRVAVEWWAIMDVGEGTTGTLPGCLVLLFANDGRCRELREYWHWEEKRMEPPPGWGE